MKKHLPPPIYLNQKDGAAFIHLKEDELKQMFDRLLIKRYPRSGSGFRYKIKELIQLADAIDRGEIVINQIKKAA